MRYITIVILSCLVFSLITNAFADWQADLNELLVIDGEVSEELVQEIVKANPDWQEVVSQIQSMSFPVVETDTILLDSTVCIDGVTRPWVLYISPAYDPQQAAPLIVTLHGGVGRAEIIDDPLDYAQGYPFTALAEKMGALVLYPFGQAGAVWWDDVGMSNVENLVRTVKRNYNIDDDRVYMGGFSDGASASFCQAMVNPTDYAAFIALNGHMGVGSLDGDLSTYAPNFYNTPIYAITTYDDQLYPSHKMRKTIEMARQAGGDIFYRELEGDHSFDYDQEELPRIEQFLIHHPRDPFPTRIMWETANRSFGQCRWFAIDQITIDPAADWHTDYNTILVDNRITIGFMSADYEGTGVKVGRVIEDSFAGKSGLQTDDIIIKGNTKSITNMDDLNDFKGTINRGDEIELTVIRGDQEVVLTGKLPDPQNYYIFKRSQPSAKAKVSFSANRIDIEASRLGAFRVLVHPDMIRLEQNLVIAVDGKVVFDEPVQPDLEFLLRNYLENRDRKLLYVAEIQVNLMQ